MAPKGSDIANFLMTGRHPREKMAEVYLKVRDSEQNGSNAITDQ